MPLTDTILLAYDLHMNEFAESRTHGTPQSPWALYECILPAPVRNVPSHWHPEFEISYVKSGSALYRIGCIEFISGAGDLILVPPNIMHSIRPLTGYSEHHDTLVFHGGLLGAAGYDRTAVECIGPLMNGSLSAPIKTGKDHPHHKELESALHTVFDAARSKDSVDGLMIKSGLLRFVWILFRNDMVQPTMHDLVADDNAQRLHETVSRISREFRQDLTIPIMARWTNMGESHFIRCFKASTGISPMEHILQLRIQAACGLLMTSNAPVLEIACKCGFSNLSNFNRHFKKRTGVSPREWRQINN